MTKRRDVVRKLEAAGFSKKGGGDHDKFVHPDGRWVPVPRHKELKETTAKSILKQAGLL